MGAETSIPCSRRARDLVREAKGEESYDDFLKRVFSGQVGRTDDRDEEIVEPVLDKGFAQISRSAVGGLRLPEVCECHRLINASSLGGRGNTLPDDD